MTLPSLNSDNLKLNGVYFVTGTDTEIGKTTTTANLVKALAHQGKTVYAIKPITAGLETDENGQTYSDDAQRINEFASINPPLKAIAPICLATPCSPHIASAIDGVSLSADTITHTIRQTVSEYPADSIFIEGAGGWLTPINDSQTLADVAVLLDFPVIVVVGIKLGSLNHAMLTVQAVWQAGLEVAMVVFNQLHTDTPFVDEQIDWLSQHLVRLSAQRQSCPPVMVKQGVLIN